MPTIVGTVLRAGRSPAERLVLAVLATGRDESGWRVFEPSSGEVRTVEPAAIAELRLGPVLGFDHLHAVLLSAAQP